MTPGQTVTAFISAVERKDLDAACALLAEDVHYDNVPMSKSDGRDAARAVLAPFVESATKVSWPVHRQTETGNVVMNERTDAFDFPNGSVAIPVMGVFEVNDEGLITLWRDYFDMRTVETALASLT
ncbi:MAG TPA: limonene-1,2-epoxide hydrolase family protein [Mycobacteriales bacterium]|nr:limonene-1,2-epoxide hydrolase family protein [Mycobacteriales bacterium]